MAKKALIVDDSASMRQMVAYTLRQGGFEVIEGENGQDALDKLPGQKIEIIITDLNMPIMDGITFIQQVRTLPAFKFVPILMLTTETQASKKEQGKSSRSNGMDCQTF